ncbi:MAG: c(7)-type cytochrome triheme domain-containing protein [Pseudomonadota bacterium]
MKKLLSTLLLSASLLAAGITPAAEDRVVVIVNQENKQALDLNQIKQIYNDQMTTWKNGQTIWVLNLPAEDPAREIFSQEVLGMSARDAAAQESNRSITNTAKNPSKIKRERLVVAIVAKRPEAIGYVYESSIADKPEVRKVLVLGPATASAPAPANPAQTMAPVIMSEKPPASTPVPQPAAKSAANPFPLKHDPKAVAVLQDPKEALADFPLDAYLQVDWAMAMKQGLLRPAGVLKGKDKNDTLDLDSLMKDTGDMRPVVFSHQTHTQLLDCAACHPKPFETLSNATPVNMKAIMNGEYCGLCHGKVAFPVSSCDRCHNGG